MIIDFFLCVKILIYNDDVTTEAWSVDHITS